jgi:beta-glucosidase
MFRRFRKTFIVLGSLVILNFSATVYLNARYPNPEWDWETIDTSKIEFPKRFLWGAATSAYQIEGDLTNNNWYVWERTKQANGRDRIMRGEVAGKAANHYKLYKEDVKLIADFGLNAYRFSIEWSRIEPQEGKFDLKAIEQYRNLIRELKRRGVEPMITLHHFTDPLWFTAKGGFEKEENLQYWLRYANRMFGEYQSEVVYWSTFNEFNLYPLSGYLEGGFPPGKKTFCLVAKSRATCYWGIFAPTRALRSCHSASAIRWGQSSQFLKRGLSTAGSSWIG